MRSTWLIAATLAALLPCGVSAQDAGEERVAVNRVLWPVLVEPEGCALALEEIRVTENGEPVEVTSFDRLPRPTLHTLLIDTSASMAENDRLAQAQEAARRYVARLRPDESAMLLSFDESLVMRAPPRRMSTPGARESLYAAIDALDTGTLTLLRDALFQLVLHLEAFPERQVIVILTDGTDALSRTPGYVESWRPAQNLTVFTVGLMDGKRTKLGRYSEPELSHSQRFFKAMARETGGLYLPIATGAEAGTAFDAIRDRLESEAWLGWIPPVNREYKSGARHLDYTFRRVRIRTQSESCTIVPLRRRRLVEAIGSGPYAHPVWPVDSGLRPLRLPLPLPPGRVKGAEALWYLSLESRSIQGRVGDLIFEGGLLYPPGKSRARLTFPREANFDDRDFQIVVPRPSELEESPEDIVLHWLKHGRGTIVGAWEQAKIRDDTLTGETFLQLAEYLAETLYRYFREYREWAEGPLRKTITTLLREQLPGLSTAQLDALVAGRLANPTRAEIGRHLAVWLGDVTALELTERLQRRLIYDLQAADGEARPALRERLDETWQRWDDVRSWLAPPDRVRVIAPLLLLRQPERIGFYRIVLPRPSLDGPPDDRVPAVPQMLVATAPLLDCAAGLDRLARASVAGDRVTLGFTDDVSAEESDLVVRVVGDAPQGGHPPECVEAWSGEAVVDDCFRTAEVNACDSQTQPE